MTSLATVFVEGRVDTRRFGTDIKSGMAHPSVASAATGAGKTTGSHFKSGFGSVLRGFAGPIIASLGAIASYDFLKGSVAAAREQQKATAQTGAVIKSTGGAANVTAGQIADLSKSIAEKTGIDHLQIQSAANMLLTFRNIRNETGKGKDIFNQTTQAVTDLSVGMKEGLRAASIQVGKALNDPIKGVTALGRVGVQFTDQQKAQIATLVAHGKSMEAQKIILGELTKEFAGSAAAQATAGDKAKVAFDELKISVGTALLPVLDSLERAFVEKIVPALYQFGGFLTGTVVPAVKDFGKFLSDNIGTVKIAAEVVAGLYLAFKAYQVTVIAVGVVEKAMAAARFIGIAATQGLTVAQEELDVALTANPIGLVVAALVALGVGLVIAYKQSATFRNIVNDSWAVIEKSIASAWAVIKPVFAQMVAFIKGPLSTTVTFLWKYVVQPYFKLIQLYIKVWWTVVKAVFEALRFYFEHVLFPIIKFLWNNVVKPVFKGIGDTISYAWGHVIKPVFYALGSFIKDSVVPAFRSGVELIGSAWDRIKDIAAAPVRFVVNTIYNDGIRAFINKISDAFGGPTLGEVKLGFAKGGVLPGWSPGRDIHKFYSPTGGALELSGGEGILTPHATKAMGGAAGIAKINQAFAAGGVFRPIGRGAPITQGLHDAYTGYPALDYGHAPGYPVAAVAPGRVSLSADLKGNEPRNSIQNGYYSYGRYMKIMHDGFESIYAHLSQRGLAAGSIVDAGQIIGLSGNTGHVVGSGHLHHGVAGRSPYDFAGGATNYHAGSNLGKFLGSGVPGIGLPSLPGWLSDIPGKIGDLLGSVSGMGSKFGPFGTTVGRVATSALGKAKDFVLNKISGFASSVAGAVGGAINIGDLSATKLLSKTPDGAKALAAKMLGSFGWSSSQMSPLVSLWNGESGWRWNAENPSSGAYGIPQALPASKMASAGSDWHDNGFTQMKWGMGYIKDVYGSPGGAFSQWSARSPHWYDSGGTWKTNTVGINESGHDEFVATTRRDEALIIKAIDRLHDMLDERGVGIRNAREVASGVRGVASNEVLQHASRQRTLEGMNV